MGKKVLYVFISITILIVSFTGCSGENGIGIVDFDPNALFMTIISDGTFRMGDTLDFTAWGSNQKPIHTVVLTYDYYIGNWEVTVKEFLDFLNGASVPESGFYNSHKILEVDEVTCEYYYAGGAYRLKYPGKVDYPVNEVTWWGAIEYCNWLSREMGVNEAYDTSDGSLLNAAGNPTTNIADVEGYRLPTEAEWEYAARGAQNDYATDDDYKFSGSNVLANVGWYSGNSTNATYPIAGGKGTHEKKRKAPNEIGLYDMSGNVWEWCHDWYKGTYYYESPLENPIGPASNPDEQRIIRGGSWYNTANFCRVAMRTGQYVNFGSFTLGFRVAQTKK